MASEIEVFAAGPPGDDKSENLVRNRHRNSETTDRWLQNLPSRLLWRKKMYEMYAILSRPL